MSDSAEFYHPPSQGQLLSLHHAISALAIEGNVKVGASVPMASTDFSIGAEYLPECVRNRFPPVEWIDNHVLVQADYFDDHDLAMLRMSRDAPAYRPPYDHSRWCLGLSLRPGKTVNDPRYVPTGPELEGKRIFAPRHPRLPRDAEALENDYTADGRRTRLTPPVGFPGSRGVPVPPADAAEVGIWLGFIEDLVAGGRLLSGGIEDAPRFDPESPATRRLGVALGQVAGFF